MKEVNPKQQIQKEWLEVKAARVKTEKTLDEEPGHPYRRRLVQEWNELLEKEAELYKQLTK